MKLPRHVVNLGLVCCVGVAGAVLPALHAQKSQKPEPRQAQKVAPVPSRIWKSEASGNEYRVWIENKTLHAEWVNIPAQAAENGAYIRTTCRRVGEKWIGTSKIFVPCAVAGGPVVNRCHFVMRMEIDRVTENRITGRVEDPKRNKFDCRTCKVAETVWKNFAWVPKQ